MIVTVLTCLLAAGLGWVLVPRTGVWGFALAALIAFLAQLAWRLAQGFEGLPWDETLALFNDSFLAYFGWSAQVTWRAFAAPALVLGIAGLIAQERNR